jgi:nucleotide-binding universal stress UspA family protein
MQTILLAIDFSEGVENCCNYAVKVAARFEAKIILFHSYFDKFLVAESNFPTGIEGDTLMNKKVLEGIKSQAELDLKNIHGCIIDAFPKAKVKTDLRGGNPEEEIVSAAHLHQVELIILGSSGKAGKGLFSGSISKKIINNTPIPVLSIPLNYTYKEIKNVLYPTEFIHDDVKIIENIFSLLSNFELKVYCLHLAQPAKNGSLNEIEKIQKQMADRIENNLLCVESIESGNFTDSLKQYVDAHQIDLITFVSHKRGFLKEIFTNKLTKKDLFQLHLPMLAIKR